MPKKEAKQPHHEVLKTISLLEKSEGMRKRIEKELGKYGRESR